MPECSKYQAYISSRHYSSHLVRHEMDQAGKNLNSFRTRPTQQMFVQDMDIDHNIAQSSCDNNSIVEDYEDEPMYIPMDDAIEDTPSEYISIENSTFAPLYEPQSPEVDER
ncbi:hypothetical protein HPULCUR_010258 [Helicostylum pulchrum]|uniref:Uncharacterized protein n=1 Tax=Helicostylum pulchrum TaxID=562976 RepID=A0ABP9YCS1_9FUNG